jgi:hypothetical protein
VVNQEVIQQDGKHLTAVTHIKASTATASVNPQAMAAATTSTPTKPHLILV